MIDTHIHFWCLVRGDYHWLKPTNHTLYRDYVPDEVQSSWDQHGIEGVIAVQAAQTIEETEYLLSLAQQNDRIVGVVGTLDLHSSDTPRIYERLRQNPQFVGIRYSLLGAQTQVSHFSAPFLANVRMFAADDFPVDLLMKPTHVPSFLRLLDQVPDLTTVANHLGSPNFDEPLQPWADAMSELAQHPKAMCKISGMITQVGGYHPEILRDAVQHLVQCYGAQRLMFGSDWPVALTAGSYDEVVQLYADVLPPSLREDERALMSRENAIRCYLKRMRP